MFKTIFWMIAPFLDPNDTGGRGGAGLTPNDVQRGKFPVLNDGGGRQALEQSEETDADEDRDEGEGGAAGARGDRKGAADDDDDDSESGEGESDDADDDADADANEDDAEAGGESGEVDEDGWPLDVLDGADDRREPVRSQVDSGGDGVQGGRATQGGGANRGGGVGQLTQQQLADLTPGERIMYQELQSLRGIVDQRFTSQEEARQYERRQAQVAADNEKADTVTKNLLKRNTLLAKKSNADIAKMVYDDVCAEWNANPSIQLAHLPKVIMAKTKRFAKILQSREPSKDSKSADAAVKRAKNAKRDTGAPVSGGKHERGGGGGGSSENGQPKKRPASVGELTKRALEKVGV